jgi:hydrogenase nickel incorporation protein HypB
VITKCDIAAAAGFNREETLRNLARISHHARVFEVSARTGQGMEEWVKFLVERRGEAERG